MASTELVALPIIRPNIVITHMHAQSSAVWRNSCDDERLLRAADTIPKTIWRFATNYVAKQNDSSYTCYVAK